MFAELQKVFARPEPFQYYTAEKLWNDPHISAQMLKYHLDEKADPASRNRTFLDRSIAWLAERFQVGPGLRIADFGCGPGLYTIPLAERGARVTGIDFSRRSIAYAREQAANKGLSIDHQWQNYLDFSSPQQFDLIIIIYCDYCALSPQQRNRLLGIIHQHLAVDGHLLFDVFSLSAYRERKEGTLCEPRLMEGFWSADDYFGFLQTCKYEDEQVVLDKYSIFEAEHSFEVYNWLQYFTRDEISAELHECGLQVVDWYADVAGSAFDPDAAEIAVIAKKE